MLTVSIKAALSMEWIDVVFNCTVGCASSSGRRRGYIISTTIPSNQFEKRERVENTTRSGVFLTSGDETLSRMLHITSQTNDFRKRN